MISRIHAAFKEWLYGPPPPPPSELPTKAPKKLREATHKLNNEVASLDAVFKRLRENYDDPLAELVRRISSDGKDHGSTTH